MNYTLRDQHEMRMKLCGLPYIAGSLLLTLLLAPSNAIAEETKADVQPAPGIAAKVLALTGAQTRIVWLRNKQWQTNKGGIEGGVGCSIMAFDTGEKGERELVPEGEIYNPLISPSGRRVIYSAVTDGKLQMFCVDWNGANRRILGEGFAQWTWRDAATGSEWLYASDTVGKSAFVDRFQVDKPETRERIYTGPLQNRFSLSADGTRAVGEFPHPLVSMFYTRTGQMDRKDYPPGCNTYIAPDNSYFVTIMDGSHAGVYLYRPDGSSRHFNLSPPGLKPLIDGSRCPVMWNPKWASDARHMSVAGPFRQLGPNHADIWLGQFADDFNGIAKWVQVTDNAYMDTYAYVWVDPGVGQYAGEAPYTLAVTSDVNGPGDWQWDYGDGTKGTEGKHTYSQAGVYAITARQGDRTLKGTVRVAERVAPKLLNTVLLDDRRVLLTCSEPVQAAAAKVTLESGTAATKLGIDSEGRGIIAEFANPLAAKETLTVTGVTDCAQVPNEMAATKTQIAMPDWPSNRTGLCYLWQNARTRNVILDERIGLPVTSPLVGGARARFNREGAAVAAGGSFTPFPGDPARIIEGVRKTHQFSFEIVVASADLAQTKGTEDKPLAIFNWGEGWRNGQFWLFQEKDKLLVGLSKQFSDPKPEVFEMATLPDTQPHHVIVSCAAKRLAFYLDGKKVREIDPSPAQLVEFTVPMMFASTWDKPDKHTWFGKFEYLAMYNRFIEEPEAAKNAAAVAANLAQRKPLPRIEVQAKLVATSTLPQPKDIAPYRNVIIVNEYEVEQVLTGAYAPKTIRVAQWGMIDLKATPLAAQKPGTSVKLALERFADHDELESELISDTLKENFDLDLFTDVNL